MRVMLRALTLTFLIAGTLGCGGGTEPIRLVDDPGIKREGAFLTWGSPVVLGGSTRLALSAAQPLDPPVQRLPGRVPEGGFLRVTLPTQLAAVPWLVLETLVTHGGKTKMMRSWPVTAKFAGTTYDVLIVTARVGDGTASIRLWPCPDLATRDVETGDVRIPAHAVLRTAVGIEEPSVVTTIVPVTMTVAVLVDGEESVLETLTLDGQKMREGWHEMTVPLDALAGRTGRFRFRARPTMGPTSVVTLPVWADPTIVDARSIVHVTP